MTAYVCVALVRVGGAPAPDQGELRTCVSRPQACRGTNKRSGHAVCRENGARRPRHQASIIHGKDRQEIPIRTSNNAAAAWAIAAYQNFA
ncbi:hypothetical protein K437DRAFT_68736 [Tilletiaria anomala UBC 951]|uniref:Uncharacterized protein n=1 Tax=Tilletiaria anomala (strain ATCC 24038 / CBS 436.72 / UBC 951) TaxID=1037660 RepID=A0A066WQT1_TILAU|nr:uncharacterized protein K437DRAFT_68736 [Tilletiaria anomala UBC 951]KDN53334.1 hypothetical protein K437DRAFT_68736 [Tilletiaria anomala UBC 951]